MKSIHDRPVDDGEERNATASVVGSVQPISPRSDLDGVSIVDKDETWGGKMADIVRDVAIGVFTSRIDSIREFDGYFGFMSEMWKLAVEVFESPDDHFASFRTVETTETHELVMGRFEFDKYREVLARTARERFLD